MIQMYTFFFFEFNIVYYALLSEVLSASLVDERKHSTYIDLHALCDSRMIHIRIIYIHMCTYNIRNGKYE